MLHISADHCCKFKFNINMYVSAGSLYATMLPVPATPNGLKLIRLYTSFLKLTRGLHLKQGPVHFCCPDHVNPQGSAFH